MCFGPENQLRVRFRIRTCSNWRTSKEDEEDFKIYVKVHWKEVTQKAEWAC